MNPSELLDALQAAGATLVVENGAARIQGKKVPAELLAAVKANREAVIAEQTRRQGLETDRYAMVPTGNVPLFGQHAKLTPAQMQLVMHYVHRQPRPLHAWVMQRAQEYHELAVPFDETEARACVDVICWQRNAPLQTVLPWLENIETAAKDLAADGQR